MNDLAKFFKNKKVLITGHTGFKGSWLLKILDMFGAKCFGVSDKYFQNNLYKKLNFKNLIESKLFDISDFSKLKKYINKVKPDFIFHLAAQPLVLESYLKPYETYKTNVIGTLNLCEIIKCYDKPISFICVTTDKVYKNKNTHYKYREDDELNGFDPYSNSKSCADLLTQTYINSLFNNNVFCSICRSGNVIGGGDFSKNRIVPDIFRSLKAKKPLEVRSQSSIRPYQHVLEANFAYLAIAMLQYKNREYCSYYNIAPDDESIITTSKLVEKFNLLNKHLEVIFTISNKFHEANLLLLNNEYIKNKIGWNPIWNIDQSINYTNEWFWFKNKNEITEKQINIYNNLWKKKYEK